MTKLEHQLLEALKMAYEHLEFCGYGDKWERECAFHVNMPTKLKAAIDAAKGETNESSSKG